MSTPRLPVRNFEVEEHLLWVAQTRLLREVEYERDSPLTERERWQEELGRKNLARRKGAPSVSR